MKKFIIYTIICLIIIGTKVAYAADLTLPIDYSLLKVFYDISDKLKDNNEYAKVISDHAQTISKAAIIANCSNGKKIPGKDLNKLILAAKATVSDRITLPEKYSKYNFNLKLCIQNRGMKEQDLNLKSVSTTTAAENSKYEEKIDISISKKTLLFGSNSVTYKIMFIETDNKLHKPYITTANELVNVYGGRYTYDPTVADSDAAITALNALITDLKSAEIPKMTLIRIKTTGTGSTGVWTDLSSIVISNLKGYSTNGNYRVELVGDGRKVTEAIITQLK